MNRLLLIFLAVPLLELYLLIKVGSVIGGFFTVMLVLITGIIGASMARAEGIKTMVAYQQMMARGEAPQDLVVSTLAITVGGILLLTPGIMTDLLGFSLLWPKTRELWISQFTHYLRNFLIAHQQRTQHSHSHATQTASKKAADTDTIVVIDQEFETDKEK